MRSLTDAVRPAGAVLLAAALAGCGAASTSQSPKEAVPGLPGTGSEAPPEFQETWEGSSLASNPAVLPPEVAACQLADDPTCHNHRLVVPQGVTQVLVAIKAEAAPTEGVQSNDFDLYVYDDHNTLVSFYGDEDGDESLVFATTGAAWYDVRVASYATVPGAKFTALARAVQNQPVNDAAECIELVPASAGLAGATDAGQRVELAVELLLDGTSPTRAREVMARAAESYAPLGIDLVLRRTRPVTIQSFESDRIIQETKALSGGRPPDDVDIVVTFTSKEMQAYDPTGQVGTVIGQADCIGGIRYPAHSFAVVTDVTAIEGRQVLPGFFLNMDAAAETMSHEIGHLMGAHHHYGNCVEGNLTSGGPGDVSPCTLMFPAVNGASLNFGALEGLVVRGHAVDYAAP